MDKEEHGWKKTLQVEQERICRLYQYERELYERGAEFIAGVDEAGRGPLACNFLRSFLTPR
jgi:ribonuclease HII